MVSTSGAPNSASGVITAFGSVFVNGTEFAVDGSTTVVDGDADDAPATADALRVGMTVDVDASDRDARQLRFTSAVRGEVDAVNTTQSTLTVLGQTVVVSSGTSFAGTKTVGSTTTVVTGLSNISVGDYVIVYGFALCTSSTSTSSCTGGTTHILASLVFEPTSKGIYATTGYAENVPTGGGSFTVNGLTVDYTTTGTSPTMCTPSPCSITAGNYIQVRSPMAPTVSGTTLTLAATRIKAATAAPVLVSGETASIEGPVNQLNTTANTFSVRGIMVDGSALASTVATLSANQIVEVTGTVNANGSIKATAITAERHATFTLVAPLTADVASADTLTVLGKTFTANSTTRFIDLSHNVQPFNLSNFTTVLSIGDQLEVSGYLTSTGLVATRVVRLPTPTTAFVAVQGVVSADSASTNTLTIGGVVVTLDSGTTLRYPNAGTMPSITGFLGSIIVGTSVVNVRGVAGSGASTISATAAGLFDADCEWADD
jgi:hypothetical protein